MKKAGKLTYTISSTVQFVLSIVGIVIAIMAIMVVAAESDGVEGAILSVLTIVTIAFSAILLVPVLLVVIFGFSKKEKLNFVGAIIAIILGGWTILTTWLGNSMILNSFSFLVAVAQLTGGILYLVGRNK